MLTNRRLRQVSRTKQTLMASETADANEIMRSGMRFFIHSRISLCFGLILDDFERQLGSLLLNHLGCNTTLAGSRVGRSTT